jgi:hypothetical protein
MTATKLYKYQSTVEKGKRDGTPVFTDGVPIKFIGLPTENGRVALDGDVLTFSATIEGNNWHTVLGYDGLPLTIKIQVAQLETPTPNLGIKGYDALLPVRNSELFAGLTTIIPHLNRDQAEPRVINLYCTFG